MQNKILIVDDEKNILWVLKKGLEKNNFHVDTATSGEKALALLEKNGVLHDVDFVREKRRTCIRCGAEIC